VTTQTAATTGGQENRDPVTAACRQQGTRIIEQRLFQRMQALEDAIAYRNARTAAPCPHCQPPPSPRCDDHGRDLDLIGEYQQALHQTAEHLHRIHTARLQTGRQPVPVPAAAAAE
jgi:hypothetical protein